MAGVCWFLRRRRNIQDGRMLAFAIHEMNSPAGSIAMTLGNLLNGLFGSLSDSQRKWVEMANDQCARLGSLLADSRDLIRLELIGDFNARRGDFSASELVAEALESLEHGFTHAGVEIKISIDADLGIVHTDRARVVRVIESMLYHGRKFRARNPLSFSARKENDHVRVVVRFTMLDSTIDDGCHDLHYIARPANDHVLRATGLGLGFSREIMSLIGAKFDSKHLPDGTAELFLLIPCA